LSGLESSPFVGFWCTKFPVGMEAFRINFL
jgi:hypothetical protein